MEFVQSETLHEGAQFMATALGHAQRLLREANAGQLPSHDAVAIIAHGLMTYYVHEKARQMAAD